MRLKANIGAKGMLGPHGGLLWVWMVAAFASWAAAADSPNAAGDPAPPRNTAGQSAPGIHKVFAGQDKIFVFGSAPKGYRRVIEIPPGMNPDAFESAPTVARLAVHERFRVTIPRYDGKRDRVYSGFLVVDMSSTGQARQVGNVRLVEELMFASKYTNALPVAASKKGLVVEQVDDALALGIKHAEVTVDLARLFTTTNSSAPVRWETGGQVHVFDGSALLGVDALVKPLSDAGVRITLVLGFEPEPGQLGAPSPDRSPEARNNRPLRSLLDPSSVESRRRLIAGFEYLADRYSQPGGPAGRVGHFVVGRAANARWASISGVAGSMEQVASNYLAVARICHEAVRKHSATARVFISLDSHWNRMPQSEPRGRFSSRQFLDTFNALAVTSGNFGWHLAYQPDPRQPAEGRVWDDASARAEQSTPQITFKNLELLPRHLASPEFLLRGSPRRIILTGQGFPAMDSPESEQLQAASFAYAWRKVAALEGVDAFLLRRQIDLPGAPLKLGLSRRPTSGTLPATPESRRRIYEVFQHADTPDWESAFAFALPMIGLKSWVEMGR